MKSCNESGKSGGGSGSSPLCTMKLCFGGAGAAGAGNGDSGKKTKKKKICPLQSLEEAEDIGNGTLSPTSPMSPSPPPTSSCIVRSFSESTSLIRHCAATASAIRDSLRRTTSPPPLTPPPLPPLTHATPPLPPPPPARTLPLPPLPAQGFSGLLRDRPTRLRSSFSIAERVKDGTLACSSVGFAAHTPLRSSFTHGMNGSSRLRSPYHPLSPTQAPIIPVGPHRSLNPPAPSPTSLSSSSTSNRGSPRPSPLRQTPTSPIGSGAPPLPPKQTRKPVTSKMPDPAPPPTSAAHDSSSGSGGGGSTLSISELREIAARQQQQVESQQKLLRQREERLRLLRSQEEQQRQFVRSNPQLFQLREKVEQQELQLRRLRSLRGQMEQFQTNNENLASELSMIQTLCTEKERDLANCIRKVNQLAGQMADLNRNKQQQPSNNGTPASLPPQQLEQKRRELQHRYPVPLGAKLSEQSHQLQARQSEADHLDRRILEMKQRLMQRHRQQRQVPASSAPPNPATSTPSAAPNEAPVPLNGEPVSAFLQRQNDATSSTGSSSNSSIFSAPVASSSSPSSSAAQGTASSSSGQQARPQPRYASRSVIQDTYTRRSLVSGSNLERYKSKAHEIYRANLSQLNVDKLSARTNTPRQVMQQHRRHRHSSTDDSPLPEPEAEPAPEVVDSGTEESSTSSQVDADVSTTPPQSPAASRPSDVLSKKSCLKPVAQSEARSPMNVTFEPLYLLLDGSLEGEMEVVRQAASQIDDVSACTEEGITALHTAICAGQDDVVEFLVKYGANVNAVDADGWSPLHCAASCNNLSFVRLLVEHGASIFLRTLSDYESALEKCEGEEDTGCAECLYNYQERLGVANAGLVYAAFPYDATNEDELSFRHNDALNVVKKGDANEKEWYWARDANGQEGYVPRNFLAISPSIVRRSRSSNSPLRTLGLGAAGISAQRPSPASSSSRIPSDHSDQTAL